ncbi:MAG: hypothetical protein QM780_03605 [Hyphomicrobium sp.]|uniref:hypothetical protein n=1 Tax=Hyphomicrobium sp. TaxID=82 RepID=UPI0039E57068
MSILGAVLSIATGVMILGFGLLLFYAWLPVFYGLVGLDLGLLLGRSLTGDIGFFAIVLGIAGAAILAGLAYVLEPYRRILIGISAGMLIGVSLASALGLDAPSGGFLGTALAIVFGVMGASVVPRYFDQFIIVSSAFAGAALVMAGANALFPGVGIFDRSQGAIVPTFLTLALAVAGIIWQMSNIAKWIQNRPRLENT